MINGIQVKICGLTRSEDAVAAAEIGADYLGFITYPKSKRYLSIENFVRFRSELPDLPKVAVTVNPDLDYIRQIQGAAFDYIQIHFPLTDASKVPNWSEWVGKDKLWIAPKIGPDESFDADWLNYADTMLWDAYTADQYGGTGHRSDWETFAALSTKHADQRWLLAGGLSGENAVEAVNEAGAKTLDMASGVELAPGIKDHKKLSLLKEALESL